jgi:hypothetical protein
VDDSRYAAQGNRSATHGKGILPAKEMMSMNKKFATKALMSFVVLAGLTGAAAAEDCSHYAPGYTADQCRAREETERKLREQQRYRDERNARTWGRSDSAEEPETNPLSASLESWEAAKRQLRARVSTPEERAAAEAAAQEERRILAIMEALTAQAQEKEKAGRYEECLRITEDTIARGLPGKGALYRAYETAGRCADRLGLDEHVLYYYSQATRAYVRDSLQNWVAVQARLTHLKWHQGEKDLTRILGYPPLQAGPAFWVAIATAGTPADCLSMAEAALASGSGEKNTVLAVRYAARRCAEALGTYSR